MYIVLEMQSNDETVGIIHNSFSDSNSAESSYHAILSSAAVSQVRKHSAFMLTDDGRVIKSECYRHEATNE